MDSPRQKCPVCDHDILADRHFRTMTKVFQSVHTKCKSCKTEVACGFTGEEFIIVTHEEYERISNAKRNQTV